MKKVLAIWMMVMIMLFVSGCSAVEGEKATLITKFRGVGEVTVKYYNDYFYLNFDTAKNGYYSDYVIVFVDTATNEEVYKLYGNCVKYYYCDENISYANFPPAGEFKGVATLENGTTAEFMVTLPIVVQTLEENEEQK